ncbi:MAG: pilus assembly protein PilM [bacterium]
MFFPLRKIISPIGLDISDLSLKFVQLSKHGNKINVQSFGKVDVPPNFIIGGEIKKEEEVVNLINKLISKPDYGTANIDETVVCLPEIKTFIKLLTINKSPNNIEDMVANEIEKHIPLSADKIYYDWQLIKESEDKKIVLVGVAPKYIVDQYASLIEKTKLSLSGLEVESTAICRCLLNEESPQYLKKYEIDYGIIDIGAKRASMIIYSKNTIATSVSIPISGLETTTRIAKTLDITMEQAEKAKIICGMDEQKAKGIVKKILLNVMGDLDKRINDVIDYYSKEYPSRGKISKLILCGGGSKINDLDKYIAKSTSIETITGNPFINFNNTNNKLSEIFTETHKIDGKIINDSRVSSVKQDASLSYATAIGLALKNIFQN